MSGDAGILPECEVKTPKVPVRCPCSRLASLHAAMRTLWCSRFDE